MSEGRTEFHPQCFGFRIEFFRHLVCLYVGGREYADSGGRRCVFKLTVKYCGGSSDTTANVEKSLVATELQGIIGCREICISVGEVSEMTYKMRVNANVRGRISGQVRYWTARYWDLSSLPSMVHNLHTPILIKHKRIESSEFTERPSSSELA